MAATVAPTHNCSPKMLLVVEGNCCDMLDHGRGGSLVLVVVAAVVVVVVVVVVVLMMGMSEKVQVSSTLSTLYC